jgi:peptide-methionine (R)-S-oxide reductase
MIRMKEMRMNRRDMIGISSAALAVGFAAIGTGARAAATFPVTLPDAEWKKKLAPDAYNVLRHEATERPFTSPLNNEHRAGIFACAGCDQKAFSSKTKFDSGTGWPSFWAPLPGAVGTKSDFELISQRTEVHCSRCGGHLGHVFDDGPKPTGKRYCMNGVAMKFLPGKA